MPEIRKDADHYAPGSLGRQERERIRYTKELDRPDASISDPVADIAMTLTGITKHVRILEGVGLAAILERTKAKSS
jgi:hypothetical protein